MRLQSDICIIGTGAVGKMAALGLAQAGLNITLLTSSISPAVMETAAWDARVYALNQVAKNILMSVKVWDALDLSRVTPVNAMQVYGDSGPGEGKLTFDAYGARVDALAWIVEDRNLNRALDMALQFTPNVRVVVGQTERIVTDNAEARIQLDNGNLLASALIIGADGGQSWVRGQCDIGVDYRSYAQRAIVTNFSCDKPHHGAAYQWFCSEKGIVALLPLSGQRVSLVWSAPVALADSLLHESPEALAGRVSAISAYQLGELHPLQPEDIQQFPLSLVRPHAITAPRVALIGDAAHVIHPLAGHGMNLGFGDVAALIRAVVEREPYRDCGDPRVLARYARTRREDILLMQLATDGLERLFGTALGPVRMVRNMGMNLVNKLPVLKRTLISHALGKVL